MNPKKIYLDYNATHPILPEALEAQIKAEKDAFGNASSLHFAGRAARKALHEARRQIASSLKVPSDTLIFTASATEANNLVLKGHFEAFPKKRTYVISKVEHPSVLRVGEALKAKGAQVHLVGVDSRGELDLSALGDLLEKAGQEGGLVSVMTVNNETGVCYPVSRVAALAHEHGMLFHTDAVQALAKLDLDLEGLDVDFASFSAHKIGGPKGVGLLYVKNKRVLEPLLLGGSQEYGLRAGTENVPGVIGFAKALEVALGSREVFLKHAESLKKTLIEALKAHADGVWVHAEGARTLPSTLSVGFEGVPGDALLMGLDLEGYALSSGSACSSGKMEPSHVLMAMGVPRSLAESSLRISLSLTTTLEDVLGLCEAIKRVLKRLRSLR